MKDFFLKKIKDNKIKNELDQIKEWEEKINQKDLYNTTQITQITYNTNKYNYDFQQYETIRSFGESVYAGKISADETEEDQSNLLENIIKVNEKSKPRIKEGKDKNEILMKVYMLWMKDENKTLMLSEAEYFQ